MNDKSSLGYPKMNLGYPLFIYGYRKMIFGYMQLDFKNILKFNNRYCQMVLYLRISIIYFQISLYQFMDVLYSVKLRISTMNDKSKFKIS